MKTIRKNGYGNLLVKLPERQLCLKDFPGYEQKYEKGMKTPYIKVPWNMYYHCARTAAQGYENQGQFSYPPQGMKTDLGFHTLGKTTYE